MSRADSPSACLSRLLGVAFAPETAALIDREGTYRSFPNRHIVLRQGERATALYGLLRGVVRGYYIDAGGADITKCFCQEGEFFSSEGLRREGSATFSIQCLEPCFCLRLPYPMVRAAQAGDTHIRDLLNRRYLDEVAELERRAKNLLSLDAAARYADFRARFPGLHGRVAQKHIASYLGVRPQSLSRIRSGQTCGGASPM